MKRISILFATLFVAIASNAQVVTFDTLTMPSANYWKGNPGIAATTTFYDANVAFKNRNDTSSFGDYWSGWAYSAKQDTNSLDYATNDIAAITGIGQDSSSAYGVAYLSMDPSFNQITFPSSLTFVKGFYITNTTIAYRSMQNGDFVAKKFGGITGNDPDFFRLDITASQAGIPKPDTIHFYLADFRDSNNANDYIVKDWRFVDLSSLGNLDVLSYNLVSSDNSGAFMNTPSYFCMDSLAFFLFQDINEIGDNDEIKIYPNPMNDHFVIENNSSSTLELNLISMSGQTILNSHLLKNDKQKMNTDFLPQGIHILQLIDGDKIRYKKLLKY
ncbi:MAG TPA: DUF4465 domain-containing protein [Chitinophagaceae bacterium]|nr:DUF4465 domain-containing protein [Chitinophagaceae bacterium]